MARCQVLNGINPELRSNGVEEKTDELVKVLVELPDHWLWKSESMWARSLGNDLYELGNSPFCAYGLNYKDVVFAIAQPATGKPRICRLVRTAGHRTLRFRFSDNVNRSERDAFLAQLTRLGTSFEGHEYRFFSLDIPPGVDYQPICDQLFAWESERFLEYETCEERVPGSFDDAPEDKAHGVDSRRMTTVK